QALASFPGAAALFAVVYQLWRDELTHQRAMELQKNEQDFIFGTASHMANVAYDRHVVFCEEYMARVQTGFEQLNREGATEAALQIGGDLVRLRQKHAAWLTTDIDEKLHPFEMALIKMGAQVGSLHHLPVGERR